MFVQPCVLVDDIVLDAVREKRFYILVNAEPFRPMIQSRLEEIAQERNPTSVIPDI